MSWIYDAVCHNDRYKHRWTSFKIEDVEYAKEGCSRCPVMTQCAMSLTDDIGVGVMFGTSEFERLSKFIKSGGVIHESFV